jgi:ubiquitin carboxyl-terminal hydrolase 4/11/15
MNDLILGQFKSTVICQQCHQPSICFDPFMFLVLPIHFSANKFVYFVPMDCEEKTIKI